MKRKKMLKRLSGVLLSVSMLLNITTTAFASNDTSFSKPEGLERLSDGAVILRDQSSNMYVKAYDLPSGNSVFEQYEDNSLKSKYVVEREQGSIQATYYDLGSSRSETINAPKAQSSPILSPRGTTSGRLGRIRFEYTSGDGSGICGAYVDYVKNTGSIKYDINGTYRDIAGLASFLASILALPAAPAMGVAKSVFAAFGFASGATSVLIPSCNLSSNYEEIEYTLTDMNFSAHKNSFYGTKYTITESGKHINDVYIEGDYYPTTSWNNHNFGTTIYTYMFNYSNWRIYAWN